ncbi:conserved protein of unknown function [Limnospira indica PCC 8005]|uniref:Uncharacterized protein n=1 Tax=Limnospira indica PCC 8005 TaxID=376219 RepID=A0A9P1P0D9_9CYAN|nr:conserved protein of unknown function [Limnospira indica PCC 8005]
MLDQLAIKTISAAFPLGKQQQTTIHVSPKTFVDKFFHNRVWGRVENFIEHFAGVVANGQLDIDSGSEESLFDFDFKGVVGKVIHTSDAIA